MSTRRRTRPADADAGQDQDQSQDRHPTSPHTPPRWTGGLDEDGLPIVPPAPIPPAGLTRAQQRQWRVEHLDLYRAHERATRAREQILRRRSLDWDAGRAGARQDAPKTVSQSDIVAGLLAIATGADRDADRVSAWTALARVTGDIQAPARPEQGAGAEPWSVTISIPARPAPTTAQPAQPQKDTTRTAPCPDRATRSAVTDGDSKP